MNITEEQRQNVIKYLKQLLEVFKSEVPAQSDPGELEWKTFTEWSDSGYRIIKGERAIRINGVCKFSRAQVRSDHIDKVDKDNLPL